MGKEGSATGQAKVCVAVADLDLAAVLLVEGRARVARIVDTPEPGRKEFVLELGRVDAGELAQAFTLGELRVEPRAYARARRALQRALRASDATRT